MDARAERLKMSVDPAAVSHSNNRPWSRGTAALLVARISVSRVQIV